ncbi:MAG: ATP-binding cassette domain-containing protein [Bacteroides sp.]|nr:ATP-binding cassette domain-containing protein [Bacteroides sp.]MCM1413183.1 ATP-binding cassette domain-containing protein [Bacteroides sp.]MCM1472075.1 ATP-binding cassette domain-containing protein [Bacteroides sp.]
MPLIDYSNVEIHRNDVVALRHVNFCVEAGQLVYLTGRVGSGKSSLLKSIYGEVPIAAGHADVLGRDMAHISSHATALLRREIGIVFQDFRLLPDRSVYDNLMFVLNATGWKNKADKEERIEQVLREMGMVNKSYKMPHALSGGEQQRVVMARALLNHPKLLLADEPTGNLDPHTGSIIMKRFHEIAAEGTAVIIATHNLALVRQMPARTFVCAKRTLQEVVPVRDTKAKEEQSEATAKAESEE